MDAIDKYLTSVSSPEGELMRELDRETHLRVVQPRMISGHIQGKFLEMLVRMLKPRNVLEIGTFSGYSTLCIAAGLGDDATIDTFEIDDELEYLAASFFARSVHGRKIRHHIGSALELVPKTKKVFDLVFIDGDKREYPGYYQMVMGDTDGSPMVRSGSFIIADNVLWHGKVAQPLANNDLHTKRILEFNELVHTDPRVENVVVPIRDGLNLIRVK